MEGCFKNTFKLWKMNKGLNQKGTWAIITLRETAMHHNLLIITIIIVVVIIIIINHLQAMFQLQQKIALFLEQA